VNVASEYQASNHVVSRPLNVCNIGRPFVETALTLLTALNQKASF